MISRDLVLQGLIPTLKLDLLMCVKVVSEHGIYVWVYTISARVTLLN